MSRRTEGRETFHRLLEWDKGHAASERLAALILINEGFDAIDPSHPLGGKDGRKDILCQFNGSRWIGAVYFPRGQQRFSSIKKKYCSDILGVNTNQAKGIVFFTNQEISLSERKEIEEYDNTIDVRIYHLERISDILNTPMMYGVRLDFLEIEMTKEEQLAYFSHISEKGISRLEKKINDLSNSIIEHAENRNIFKEDDEDIRSLDEVMEMEHTFFDKIWFDRHMGLAYRVDKGSETVEPTIWKDALKAAQIIIDKYGEENLGPYSDFEWGMLNGKLSALRWILGYEWDMLDT